MPVDPAKIIDATKKTQQHLANHKKRRETVQKALKELNEKLTAGTQRVHACMGPIKELLTIFATANKNVEEFKQQFTVALQKSSVPNPKFEMAYRRYLEADKAHAQIMEDYNEKKDAFDKNKTNQKAKMEFELISKAVEKVQTQWQSLFNEAQELENTFEMKSVEQNIPVFKDAVDLLLTVVNALDQNLTITHGNTKKVQQAVDDLKKLSNTLTW